MQQARLRRYNRPVFRPQISYIALRVCKSLHVVLSICFGSALTLSQSHRGW